MGYLFDDASSQFIAKSSAMGAISISMWFKPDDLGIDSTLYVERNGLGTAYLRIQLLGSTGGDAVTFEYTTAVGPNVVTSSAAANLNAWNHVYAARGIVTARPYISLNGATLQDSGLTAANTGTPTLTAVGRFGLGSQYFSGTMGEIGVWNNALHDFDDRWKSLYYGVPPWEIPVDPNATMGLSPLNLISDTPLLGSFQDLASGSAAWTASTSPSKVNDHPPIRRMVA